MSDGEIIRFHRRACTDMAARMRLPRWDQLPQRLHPPMQDHTVRDLLERVIIGNLEFAADLQGQLLPSTVDHGTDPIAGVIESIRTVLTVVSGLNAGSGVSSQRAEQFWTRIVELTVLGHDLQQTIAYGAGPDDILIERIVSGGHSAVEVWPGLDPVESQAMTPQDVLLSNHGRMPSVTFQADQDCATGEC